MTKLGKKQSIVAFQCICENLWYVNHYFL